MAGQNAHEGIYMWVPVFQPNLFVAIRCSECVSMAHELPTTATRCVTSNSFLLNLFQVAAEHVEHVQSVKWALESTDESLEEMKLEASKEHEGKLLIFFLTND